MPAKEPLAKPIFGRNCRSEINVPMAALLSNKILSFANGSCEKSIVSGSETEER
jgi:hypothetical protein